MNDVAAPLYRFFLADAQAAARAGDVARMLECLGLALDFVPESQRERMLVAAAELAPPATWSIFAAASVAAAPALAPVVVQVAPGARPAMSRITWEDRAARALPAAPVPQPVQPTAPEPVAKRARVRLGVFLFLLALASGAGAGVQWGLGGAAAVVQGDPLSRAAGALASGDALSALALLNGMGYDASAPVWLLRASAHEALADTGAAIRALGNAATHDAEGGAVALEAGDRLLRLGAVREAADAYLYAVTPARTTADLERIARVQEQAGYPERARRVRQ